MLKICKHSVVYVVCPSFNKTGGTELAHQLVYEINKNGGIAQIAYYDKQNRPLKLNDAFKCYVSSFIDVKDVVDSEQNVLIVPEVDPEFMNGFKNIQKCIWWMSVDNYLKHRNVQFARKYFGFFAVIKGLIRGRLRLGLPKFDESITHFYQSEYARVFLGKCGVQNVARLSDYINQSYLESSVEKERNNQVLYNPRKGIKFTNVLMKTAPDLKWIPIQNMTTEEVRQLLLHSKVYVDFGTHPGKDRFPREAAMSGCCVLTGLQGSAAFSEDVPIDASDFKYSESKESVGLIVKKIRQCLDDYEKQSLKFDGYRNFIRQERSIFENDVKNIFSLNS